MRIGNPISRFFGGLGQVQSGDKDGGTTPEQYSGDPNQQPKKHPGSNPYAVTKEELVVTDEKVKLALDAFTADGMAQANGLKADVEGTGPGLRVVLTDGSGAVIRQLTGEEFLRLGKSFSKDVRQRGKILDQKL